MKKIKLMVIVLGCSLLVGASVSFAATESTEMSEQSTQITQSEETKPTSLSEDNIKVIEENVTEKLVEVEGNKSNEVVPMSQLPTVAEIRKALNTGQYGIDEVTVGAYTDQQLSDAMTLFARYNEDYSGMDYGSYVRLLNTIYTDRTVNVDDALSSLSFAPESVGSYGELIPVVDTLQAYLQTLYPANSSFLAAKEISKETLIRILTDLNDLEKSIEQKGGSLPFGRISAIVQLAEHDPTYQVTGVAPVTTETTTESSKETEINSETETSKVVDKDQNEDKKESLPKTGEEKMTWAVGGLGIVILILVVILFIRKRRQ